MKTNKEWNSEKRGYEKTTVLLVGRTIRVRDVERGLEDQIGYTSAKGSIHLAYDHPIMDGLNKLEKAAFRKGVFAHEALHQIFTDFKAHDKLMRNADPFEKNILGVICNVLEDPAIENYASTVMGGSLLKCLKFSIAHIYRKSPEINEDETAMGQFISALIHFGDMGLVKGTFTFPEAKSCFAKAAPLFYKGINEPVGKIRLDIAKEIFEISRPLWQKEVDQAKMLDELMKKIGEAMKGSGSGQDGDPDALPEEDKKNNRRKITIKKISKEEYEEMKNNSSTSSAESSSGGEGSSDASSDEENSSGSSSSSSSDKMGSSGSISELPDGDITIYVCDEADDEDGNESNGSSISIPQGNEVSDPKENKSSRKGSNSEKETTEKDEDENSSGSGSGKEKTEDNESSDGSGSDKNSEKIPEEDSTDGSNGPSGKNSSDEESEDNSESESNGSSTKSSNETSEESGKNPDKNSENNSDDAEKDNTSENENSDENSEDISEEKSSKQREANNNNSSNNAPFRSQERNDDIKIKYGDKDEEYDNEDATIDEEEYLLSVDDLAYIKREQEKEIEEYEEESKENESDTSAIDDIPIFSPSLGRRSCLNYRVSFNESERSKLEEAYETVLMRLNPSIKNLSNQLKKIFQNDMEEKLYKGSGKVNINRMHSGRLTTRIFDKKRSPNDKDDLAIMLIIDESGSMSGNRKYMSARESAIALAEVFASLNIPIYIMGFTADTQGHDVVHNHYITWKNTKSDRLKLLNISARCNNCDGYSIRYGTQILKKSKAKYKLMLILSDGQPAAYSYNNGIADTKMAIKEAKKIASVLGVAIGNNDTNTIHYMYENDFLHISNVNELFFGLARKIKTLIRNWD